MSEETARIHVLNTGEVKCTIGVPGEERRDVPVDQCLVAQGDADAIMLSLDDARLCIQSIFDGVDGRWDPEQSRALEALIFEKNDACYAVRIDAERVPAALRHAITFMREGSK